MSSLHLYVSFRSPAIDASLHEDWKTKNFNNGETDKMLIFELILSVSYISKSQNVHEVLYRGTEVVVLNMTDS